MGTVPFPSLTYFAYTHLTPPKGWLRVFPSIQAGLEFLLFKR
jgi:hypothetical protein